jgi:hypothetical protein
MFKTYLTRAFSPMWSPDSASGVSSSGGDATSSDAASEDNSYAEAQGLPTITEAELMGEAEDESKDDESKDDESKDDESDDDKSKVKPKDDDDESGSKDDKSAAAPKPKSEAPPKGYVPLAALKENREENQFLKDQIALLNTRLDSALTKPVEAKDDITETFEVLSKADYAALVAEDPAEALIYMQDLNVFQQQERAKSDQEKTDAQLQREADEAEEETQYILNEAAAEMEKVVPGIFDEESTVHDELVNFAGDLGFTDDMFYLTNPSTKFILPGSTEPMLLGDQAASILKVLATSKSKIGEATKAVDETAIETRVRAEVTKELLAKFKKQTGSEFKSITQVPKAEGGKDFDGSTILSEAQLEKLSAKDYESYLAGEY